MTLPHVLSILASCCAALCGCAAPRAVDSIQATPAEGAVVPLTLENFMPVVDASTQGRTLRLIVDLGGTDALSLSQSALRDLDVEWTGRHRFIFDAFGRLWRGREFIVPEVAIADLTLHGVRGYEIPDSRFQIPGGSSAPDVQLDGYVGVDLLRRFNVLVDYPNGRLVLVDHAAAPPEGVDDWPGTPFTFDRKGVVSRIMLDGRPILANWDTGATHTVIRPDRAMPHWPRWQRGPQEAVTVESLSIGGADLGAFNLVLLEFRQPRVDVIIGTNLFAARAVWFDFSRRRLAVDPTSAPDVAQPALPGPVLTRQQAEEDLDRLVEAVRYAWSYEEDRRMNFGVDLDELRRRALAEIGDEVTHERFAQTLRRFVAGMQDGHAWVRVPGVEQTTPRRWPFTLVDAVEGVLVDDPAEGLAAAPERGDELVAVDGVPVEERLDAVATEVFASTPGQRRLLAMQRVRESDAAEHEFDFRRPDGSAYRLPLPTGPWPVYRGHWHRLPVGIEWREIETPDDESAIGYLRIGSFLAPDSAAWAKAPPEQREEVLAEVTARIGQAFVDLAATEALILDLRHNGGGTDLLAMKVSNHLLPPGYLYYRLQAREGRAMRWGVKHIQRPVRPPGITPYGGRLVVLIDEATFSASDNLAACLADLHPDITFIGRPTGAGTGAPGRMVTLPHSGASVFACSMRVYRPNGDLIEGRGVQPDVLVQWSRQDFLDDRDPDLEAAIQALRPRLK